MRTGRIVAAMALAVLTVSACGTAASSLPVAHTTAMTAAANPSTPGCNQINNTLNEAFGNSGIGIALTLYSLVGNFSYMPGDWLKADHVQGVPLKLATAESAIYGGKRTLTRLRLRTGVPVPLLSWKAR